MWSRPGCCEAVWFFWTALIVDLRGGAPPLKGGQPRNKRRTHSPEFMARVAMEAVSGCKTIQEIAADHPVHQIQVCQWKKVLHEGASKLFTRGRRS